MSTEEILDAMTKEERSQLLYLETRAVDHRGFVDGRHMNADDFKICEQWAESGFLRFSRTPSRYLPAIASLSPGSSSVVELSESAWLVAGLERRRRATRTQNQIVQLSLEHFEGLKTGTTIRTPEGVFVKK